MYNTIMATRGRATWGLSTGLVGYQQPSEVLRRLSGRCPAVSSRVYCHTKEAKEKSKYNMLPFI